MKTPAEATDNEPDLLPREPPPFIARALSYFLLTIFLGMVWFAGFVHLPESVRCRFVLAPEGGSAPIAAPEAGVVDEILVQAGQTVTAGDVVMSLVPYVEPASSAAELRARVERLDTELAAATQVNTQLEAKHRQRMEDLRSDLSRAQAQLRAAESRAETFAQLTAQLEKAAAEGAVSQKELLERKQEQQEADVDAAEARRSAAAARRALDAEDAAREVEISERQAFVQNTQGEAAEARAALMDIAEASTDDSSPEVIAVRAPHDGVVVSVPAERSNLVVERGAALVVLARPGAKLRAEITIPESGAARIAQGETVDLLFDAYPYTQHGVIKGVLDWVSPAAQNGTLTAFTRLEDATVVVDEQRRPLRAGMMGEARIHTGSRTLLEYVFVPLQWLREKVTPGSSDAG